LVGDDGREAGDGSWLLRRGGNEQWPCRMSWARTRGFPRGPDGPRRQWSATSDAILPVRTWTVGGDVRLPTKLQRVLFRRRDARGVRRDRVRASSHCMKPPVFDYAAPATLAEATALLVRHDGDAKVLSGGQSLVPLL